MSDEKTTALALINADGSKSLIPYDDFKARFCGNAPDTVAKMFFYLCFSVGADPRKDEAWLIKYGDTYQRVLSRSFWEGRAMASGQFDGIRSGLLDENNKPVDKWHPEKVVAAWAEVFRKDCKYPFQITVTMKECNNGRGRWAKPETAVDMLQYARAETRALRKAFPLGGAMIAGSDETEDEQSPVIIEGEVEEHPRLVEEEKLVEEPAEEQPATKPRQEIVAAIREKAKEGGITPAMMTEIIRGVDPLATRVGDLDNSQLEEVYSIIHSAVEMNK